MLQSVGFPQIKIYKKFQREVLFSSDSLPGVLIVEKKNKKQYFIIFIFISF
jgi:hypothetical protein